MGLPGVPPGDPTETNTTPAQSVDPRHKALAVSLEFTKRLFEVKDLDDLYFVLTNDIRALINFDRAFLIIHLEERSSIVSLGNQPQIETNTEFHDVANTLGYQIRDLKKGLFLSSNPTADVPNDEQVPFESRQALQTFLELSKSSYVLCVPLMNRERPVGHLVVEYFTANPNQLEILTIINISPLIAVALVDNWIFSKKPEVLDLIDPNSRTEREKKKKKIIYASLLASLAFVLVFFIMPIPFNVGGEAEVVPTQKHVSFCGTDGIVDRILVKEGSHVEQDQVIAVLDTKELDFKIKSAKAQYDILTHEAELLKAAAYEDPSKLAESNLVDLKRRIAWEEYYFYNWERQFFQIKAPVKGIVTTKEIETLAGKKFKSGEPFCEIAIPKDLSVDLFLPQDRITNVKVGQTMTVHFDSDPKTPHNLTVRQMAPIAETVPRLGSVYRVRAPFPNAPKSTLMGMKGIASIHVKDSSLWNIVTERLANLWRRLALRIV